MKPALDTRFFDPARIEPTEQTIRSVEIEIANDVAEQLYAFPTPEYPHLRTFVNEPEVVQRIFTNYGHDLAPDIVVLEWPERQVSIVGEVLTPAELTIENARNNWLPLSRLEAVAFYLYVPSGYANQARKLMKEGGIKRNAVGLRTWRRLVGQRMLDIVFLR